MQQVGASLTGEDFKEVVRSHTDLSALIGEKVALTPTRGGREYKGLCPFHDDRNPSFTVSPERGTYRCWSCQEGGDCFSFVMKTEKLDFRGALELLARRAGLEMPTYGRRQSGPKRDETLAALDWAAGQFAESLADEAVGRAARDYFEARGFSGETIRQFRLGFHPRDWTMLVERARGTHSLESLESARLAKKSERTGDWIDAFVGRVMFPIRNERGQTVAFGGRVLPGDGDDRGPKYLNSAESAYFSKQKTLFGLDVAREAVVDSGTAVIVEGYTDCVTLHQFGVTNAVGVLGTALTDSHARLLKRFCRRVVLIFDGDEAGQRAADRSVQALITLELDIRILVLPDGLDPDEFLNAHGVEALRQRIDTAHEAWRWKFSQAAERYGTDTLDSRERILGDLADVISGVPSDRNPRIQMMIALIATRLQMPETLVRDRLKGARQSRPRVRPQGFVAAGPQEPEGSPPVSQVRAACDRLIVGRADPDDRLEATLLEELLARPEYFSVVRADIAPEEFRNIALGKLLRAMDAVAQDMHEGAGMQHTSRPESRGSESPPDAARAAMPDFAAVMAKLTHPDLKRLLIYLDDRSRARSAAPTAGGGDDTPPGELPSGELPPLLRRPVERIRRRREEHRNRQTTRRLHQPESPEDVEDALRNAARFNHQRASGPA